MSQTGILIQLIGPPNCGKTLLRRSLCPDAVDIWPFLTSSFNAPMLDASGYWFDLDSSSKMSYKAKQRLSEWIAADEIGISIKGEPSTTTKNPGIWICEGRWPLCLEGSLIWNIKKGDPFKNGEILCNAATSLLKQHGMFQKILTYLDQKADMRDDRIETIYDAVFYKLLEMMS